MDISPDVLVRLSDRVDQLEDRVSLLEHPLQPTLPISAPAAIPSNATKLQADLWPSTGRDGAMFLVLGKALLGMAGAYALRAVAESGSFPKLATVALAIAYAAMWLIGAVWVPVTERFASTTYASTSALILAPMLWELTLRFRVLSPVAAAGILSAFLLTAYLLAWRRNLTPVVWVANITTAITAVALLIATHDMVPFIIVLLLMTVFSEYSAERSRWLGVRFLAAIAADFCIWVLIFIYSSPDNARPDYAPLSTSLLLAPALVLFLIYGTHIALRTVMHRLQITFFEAFQTVIAFLLAADAILHFGPAKAITLFAISCLTLSGAGYVTVYLRFSGMVEHRNYQVFAFWSAALLLLGSFLCVNPLWLPSFLVAVAIIATSEGVRTSRLMLAFQGFVFLLAGALASGWLPYVAHALAGTFPAPPMGTIWLVAASAILCYMIGGQFRGTAHWEHRLYQAFSAMLAISSLATVLVSAMVWITATVITPGASHVAVIRTLAGCSLALALALLGPLVRRTELVWIAYATLACVAAKLLFEDLRQGHPEFIAASIAVYAITLLLVPRVVRRAAVKSAAVITQDEVTTVHLPEPH